MSTAVCVTNDHKPSDLTQDMFVIFQFLWSGVWVQLRWPLFRAPHTEMKMLTRTRADLQAQPRQVCLSAHSIVGGAQFLVIVGLPASVS